MSGAKGRGGGFYEEALCRLVTVMARLCCKTLPVDWIFPGSSFVLGFAVCLCIPGSKLPTTNTQSLAKEMGGCMELGKESGHWKPKD
jgi:hypothetical protein